MWAWATSSRERSCPAPVFPQTSSVCVICSHVETSLIDRPVGTGLLLCFTDNGASFNVQLDGQEPAADVPNDLACIVQGASKTISFQNLEFKAHSFVLSVTNASSAHEFRFFGAVMSTSIALLRYGLLDRGQLNFGSLMARFFSNDDKTEEKVIDDTDPAWNMQRQSGAVRSGQVKELRENSLFHRLFSGIKCLTRDSTVEALRSRAFGAKPVPPRPRTASRVRWVLCIRPLHPVDIAIADASAVVLNGVPDIGSSEYTVILEGADLKFESTLHASWRIPGTPVFFHSGLDPQKTYKLRFLNWTTKKNDCDSNFCCQEIDTLVLVGSSMRFSG